MLDQVRDRRKDFWSLTKNKGFLTIDTQDSDLFQGRNQPLNFFLRQAPKGDYEFSTKLNFSPAQGFEQEGLVAWDGSDNYMKLSFVFTDRKCSRLRWKLMDVTSQLNLQTKSGMMCVLKMRKHGTAYTFFVSRDGEKWIPVGIPFDASYGNEQIGLFAISPVSGRLSQPNLISFIFKRTLNSSPVMGGKDAASGGIFFSLAYCLQQNAGC
ncbi:DUF1349 domain-containing protein [Neobacillus terrae]|uniref:beta-xylosidase family glycoside hydrolase n=1 Tax=Neobacillus terrae TaxID=3034837 RepID=UPI00140D820E|nr:DUF1349 domain-containing protein [Neobacillus terrae]NHM30988.1 DUF1349 domain-containing protein [Neobacillus terrae]